MLEFFLITVIIVLIYVSYRQQNEIRKSRIQIHTHDQQIDQRTIQLQTIEKNIVESRALFSTLVHATYDLVFVLNEEQIVIAANESTDDLFNHRYSIGEKLTDLIDAPELRDVIEQTLATDESLEAQLSVNEKTYRLRTRIMRYQDNRAFVGIALQDITRLVQLNRARRDLVANISHELRTPIANIRLIIDSLFHEKDKPKRKDSIASLHAIASETDTLLWLAQELLDLSMIESGQAILKLVETPLKQIVDQSLERLEDQLDTKEIRLVQEIPRHILILCDPEQTRRVLVNLIHNAIKWSPTGKAITLHADVGTEEVTISVFDEGPGVPTDQRERIFERFYQVDASRSGHEGTGLGLAICKHIVEAHGGRIWAEDNSMADGGCFKFTLLLAQQSSDNMETEAIELPSPS